MVNEQRTNGEQTENEQRTNGERMKNEWRTNRANKLSNSLIKLKHFIIKLESSPPHQWWGGEDSGHHVWMVSKVLPQID